MKQNKQKFALTTIFILIICICVMLSSTICIFAVNQQNPTYESIIKNMTDKEISKFKQIKDFEENKYSLFELENNGYFIFCNSSNELLEWSVEAKSPYLNISENLYYAGLQSYYYKSENNYYNINSNKLVSNDEISKLTDISKKIQSSSKKVMQERQTRATPSNNNKYVSQSNIFENMTSHCGYATDKYDGTGLCGYIALAMIIDYYYIQDTTAWIKNSSYVQIFNGKYVPTEELTHELRRIGKYECGYADSGTTSVSIKNVATKYASNVGISIQKTDLTLFISYNTIRNHIINSRPVILFGSFTNPTTGKKGNHAVVCYGTYDYGVGAKGYITHFGYEDQTSPGYRYNGIGISTGLSDAQLGSIFSMWRV